MKASTSVGNKPADVFKTFPEFSKLTLADRDRYEELIKNYPPYSDYSFPTLMNWWNALDCCAISTLNDNLVISYWIPGVDSLNGMAVVGINKVDQTICEVIDYLNSKGENARLVHVPEFVIENIEHPELFNFDSERDTDEYVLSTDKYFPLQRAVSFRRFRINKFLKNTAKSNVVIRNLELNSEKNRFLLMRSVNVWPNDGPTNATVQHSDDAMVVAINEAEKIGTECLCLFIDDKLHAFILFTRALDKRYAVFSHYKSSQELPYTIDYVLYSFAEWFVDHDIRYLNIDADLGVRSLRVFKIALGPQQYFRKYTVTIAN
jgi:hypothetical protein